MDESVMYSDRFFLLITKWMDSFCFYVRFLINDLWKTIRSDCHYHDTKLGYFLKRKKPTTARWMGEGSSQVVL